MTRKQWTQQEEGRLKALYPNTPMRHLVVIFQCSESAIYGKANLLGVNRSEAFLQSAEAGRIQAGSHLGRCSRFAKGQKPWNSGMKGWQAGGRAKETQFKKGSKPHTWQPIGHERVTRDGYLERKITDTGVTRHDYQAVHRLEWIKQHGEIPAGHVIVFKDALPKHQNITIDRLECISRGELAKRNTIHRYPPELKQVIRLQRKLERKVKERADEK